MFNSPRSEGFMSMTASLFEDTRSPPSYIGMPRGKQKSKCTAEVHKWSVLNTLRTHVEVECRRCRKIHMVGYRKQPFGDKRNFRRSDPLYARYQNYLRDSNGGIQDV